MWSLAQDPSGGRIRFLTDATEIGLSAQGSAKTPSPNMSAIAFAGVDLYADDIYVGSATPDKDGKIEKLWRRSANLPGGAKITLYLPLYQPLTVDRIELLRFRPGGPAQAIRVIQADCLLWLEHHPGSGGVESGAGL